MLKRSQNDAFTETVAVLSLHLEFGQTIDDNAFNANKVSHCKFTFHYVLSNLTWNGLPIFLRSSSNVCLNMVSNCVSLFILSQLIKFDVCVDFPWKVYPAPQRRCGFVPEDLLRPTDEFVWMRTNSPLTVSNSSTQSSHRNANTFATWTCLWFVSF